MDLVLVGLNHKTAPVEIREQLAIPSDLMMAALNNLASQSQIEECMIVSTCNRVEVIAKIIPSVLEPKHIITDFLYPYHSLSKEKLFPHLYVHRGSYAVRHLFRVAASLDSMILGEPQILGQVKAAYSVAIKSGSIGRILHNLLARTFAVAKKIRTETKIANYAVSVSFVAVELAKKIFEDLKGKIVLLIGAGEMAELSAKHLVSSGVSKILLANRTIENANKLANILPSSEVINFEEIEKRLSEADVVIASTGADSYVVTSQMAKSALEKRRNHPILFIDLSVPRNIDPLIANIDNLFVFDIDDLEHVVASNLKERHQEAKRAEVIIEAETEQFVNSFQEVDIGPIILALKDHLHNIALSEYKRCRKHLGVLTLEQEESIQTLLLNSIINKFMHPIIIELRKSSSSGLDYSMDVSRMYELDKFIANHENNYEEETSTKL